ncbi:MAG: cadmium-translocating P-type ATPase [Oscillospiraceae bacterium]|nr:cadmium-translocating P-type ATPase [Oscillospiraceae bacterium]MBR0452184.1 cadmium-translocating P-type ATPase [Oscillospiraceae bacterium]
MTTKQKKSLNKILIAAISFIVVLALKLIFPFYEKWISFLYLIPYFIVGLEVLEDAWNGIKNGEVFDENFLMSVATIGAIILGEFQEGVAVMFFYQVGELFQSYAVGKSRQSISDLMDISPEYANLVDEDGSITEEDPEDVPVGSTILVRPGERIPMDGIVIEGSSSIDTSALTGESMPVHVKPGSDVISGCVNESAVLKIQTTKLYEDSTVARILELVENSSMKKAKVESFITRFSRYYTPAVCYSALALAVVPSLITGDWKTWILRALTFLVISCPCALVISIPLSFFGGIGGASRSGILVKGGNDLEALSKIQKVVFDKTGTLTEGRFRIADVVPEEGIEADHLLRLAALAESYTTHPIGEILRKGYEEESRDSVEEVKEIAGKGIIANIDSKRVAVGNVKLLDSIGVSVSTCDKSGTVIYVSEDDVYIGYIRIADSLKPDSARAVKELHDCGIETVLLSGDNEKTVKSVADELNIVNYHAELLPEGKVMHLEELMASNDSDKGTIGFVGDGINDAPVLMRSDVGIAMGAMGSDAAIEAADVVLMDDNLRKLPLAVRISKKCMRIVIENIIFSLAVKFICLILAAFGFANMWWAVFSDVGVMVIAVLNATRMLRPMKLEE